MAEHDGSGDEATSDLDPARFVAELVGAQVRPGPGNIRPPREHVVAHALKRPALIPAQAEIHGVRVARRMIHTGDPIDVRFAKYLQHAVQEDQWPAGTTFDEFLASIVEVVSSDDSGVFADHRPEGWRVTFVSRSGSWEGLEGAPFLVVVYDCRDDRLVTAFQPTRGLEYVDHNEQVVTGTWLRRVR